MGQEAAAGRRVRELQPFLPLGQLGGGWGTGKRWGPEREGVGKTPCERGNCISEHKGVS